MSSHITINYDEIHAQIRSCKGCCIWENSTSIEKDCNEIFSERISDPQMNFNCSNPQRNAFGFGFQNAQIMFCEKRLIGSYIIGEDVSGGNPQNQVNNTLFNIILVALTFLVLNTSLVFNKRM